MNTISIQQAVGTALSHRIAADVALPRRQNDLPVELVAVTVVIVLILLSALFYNAARKDPLLEAFRENTRSFLWRVDRTYVRQRNYGTSPKEGAEMAQMGKIGDALVHFGDDDALIRFGDDDSDVI